MAALAARQDGVVELSQLRACGLGSGAIHYRASTGRLHPLLPRVYAVGHRAIGRRGSLVAALLHAGPTAFLSHWTAAELHDLARAWRRAIHVTVPGRNGSRRGDLILHRCRRVEEIDTVRLNGLRVASVARTLLDLAGMVRSDQLVGMLEQAQRIRIFDLHAIESLLERSSGRRGAVALRRALAELADDAPDVRSQLERRFLTYCRNRGLPAPAMNVVVEGYTVDASWPAHKVIAELDTYSYHGHRRSFEEDRKRDIKLQLARHRVVRITDRRLRCEADELERELRALLAG